MSRRAALLALLALPVGLAVAPGAANQALDRLSCLAQPFRVVELSTSQEGVLRSVQVSKGDRVARGQVIATLVSEVEQANVNLAAERTRATASLESRQARVDYARARLERVQGLGQKQFVSSEEMDELRLELALAKLALREEQERIVLARLDLERARALLELRTVRSPIDGVVVERYLSEGEFAQAQRIVRVAQVDPLTIEVALPASRFGSVRQGQAATVRLAAPVGGAHAATVTQVDSIIDGASATFTARLELANPDYRLPAGIDCQVDFEGD